MIYENKAFLNEKNMETLSHKLEKERKNRVMKLREIERQIKIMC